MRAMQVAIPISPAGCVKRLRAQAANDSTARKPQKFGDSRRGGELVTFF